MNKEDLTAAREIWEPVDASNWEAVLDAARQIVAQFGDLPEPIAHEMMMSRSEDEQIELLAIRPRDGKPYDSGRI